MNVRKFFFFTKKIYLDKGSGDVELETRYGIRATRGPLFLCAVCPQ